MRRRTSTILILSLLLMIVMAMTAFAAIEPVERRKTNLLLTRVQQYTFRQDVYDAHNIVVGGEKAALGSPIPSGSQGVGALLGDTWYDYQRNGSMRRMIAWEDHPDPGGDTLLVHFNWMRMAGSTFVARKDYYKVWNAKTGAFPCEVGLQPDDEYAGYTTVTATRDNRAIVTNHNDLTLAGDYAVHPYWDFGPANCFFTKNCRVPDSVASSCQIPPDPGDLPIWPASAWEENQTTGVKTLHVLALEPGGGALVYFHTHDPEATAPNCEWEARCVDTVPTLSQDIDCNDEGKVVLGWVANVPNPGDCDTCSGDLGGQTDNDLYWQISPNSSGHTWLPRLNITKNVDTVDGYRPYTDVSVLIDSKNDAHIVWNGAVWDAVLQTAFTRNRIFHYSEDNPSIRTAHNSEWDQTTCGGGAWNLNSSKQTVSECDGKLYVLFTQFNDIPNGIEEDCGWNTPGGISGAGNGELFIVVSADYGLTWDQARNLTNSRSELNKGDTCDKPGGDYGPCPSEHWSSMVRFGTNYVGQFPNNTVTPLDCAGDNGYSLDIQYIDDNSPGGIVQGNGYWTSNDVRWFRIPCCDPIPNPLINLSPGMIGYPCWTKHGVQKDVDVDVENSGNAVLNYTYTEEEDTGPSGWLSTSSFDGSVPSGLNNVETGTVHINTGGIVNTPGTIVYLSGRLIFNSNAPTTPDTLSIECWVTDTLVLPIWDTISTTCTKLTVSNHGNFGNQGKGKVNLDYIDAGDCDTTDAEVYLYDASPVVAYVKAGDTMCNWSIFNTTPVDDEGFIPIGPHTPTTDMGEYEVFESGPFVTHDSLIAVEKVWFAPKAPVDSCSFVIQCIKIYLTRDTTVTIRVGEALDWDIPADSGSDNASGFDPARNLIWQQGGEYNQDDTTECQENDRRWGGIDFLECYKNGSLVKTDPHGAYTADNPTYVYPNSGFVPEELYSMMDTGGYRIYVATPPDPAMDDIHMVMTFDTGLVLTITDTIVYYVSIISHWNGSYQDFLDEVDEQREWYCQHIRPGGCGCCIGIRGNVDGDAGDNVNVADLTFLVDYLFRGGPAPECQEEANVDGDAGENVNVADLTYLVDYLFRGGPPPPSCP